ncbi:unnamed protein product [Paramecium primaurelia]|uniref:CCHC-type domain-containing protein n=4 Tax=Paramecium TaxID=5884 RepID=A0CMC7_PARTE|nr:uncharacterized protein GSPATT00008423001 [Paramecium tetraurelia]CAD8062457.1 unnamed protein product [Paramecium primaurelia]CAD8156539.1 unnamed protein product [Paramecium octaurelia]CAD8160800.1 unnamed protein product [Paramecium pentaurelia]CAK71944.1 unnamed protein product [Paramecium tetraurelia]|eukprot:XP_001439341.1 hypothetical protein (macronuclear) [Paramecium tetraurelia strain d4-2]
MSSDSGSHKKEEANRIYVTGYSAKESEMEIKNAFARHGEIQEFSWKGRFCFIAYAKPEDASDAVRLMNMQDFNGRNLIVELARAKKKDGACYQCGKQGHFARNCRLNRRSYSDSRRHSKKKKKHPKHRSSSSSSSSEKKKSKKKRRKSSSSSHSRSSD